MLKLFTAHEVETMRRDAKRRTRANGMILAKALDQIAAEHGYRNWSLLQKNGNLPSDKPQPWFFRRSSEEIARSMRVAPDLRSRAERRTQSQIARDSMQALDAKFASAANAVDFAIAYVEGILSQPRFQLSTKSIAYWEMRHWLPYGAIGVNGTTHILVNRSYKPQGSTSESHAEYEEFPQLWLQLKGDSWRSFVHPTASQPFLFNDGCPPWRSRKNAEAYLERLKELRKQL